jgi:hypothetical protein
LEFLAAYFERVAEWREADEDLVAAALKEAGAVPLTAVHAKAEIAKRRTRGAEAVSALPLFLFLAPFGERHAGLDFRQPVKRIYLTTLAR